MALDPKGKGQIVLKISGQFGQYFEMAAATDSRRTSAVAESQASRPYTDATWMTQSGTHPMGKGQILFTGKF